MLTLNYEETDAFQYFHTCLIFSFYTLVLDPFINVWILLLIQILFLLVDLISRLP